MNEPPLQKKKILGTLLLLNQSSKVSFFCFFNIENLAKFSRIYTR
jgi:hypothetical protein